MQRQTVPPTMDSTVTTGPTRVTVWRARSIAFLRIAFGIVWAIDAWLKWQPAFINSFSDQITSAQKDQPQGVQNWISFWAHIVSSNPHFFAYLTAVIETGLALFLLLGLLTNLTCLIGIIWSLGIWAIPEGFGGPYTPGQSTDIGTAILYALMFAVLFAISAGRYYGLDQWLTPRLGRLGFLASGKPWGAMRAANT
jgi:thiosulfate dehydrogenase (quinone) large subunit